MHTEISNRKIFEQIELSAKLLNYFLQSNDEDCLYDHSWRNNVVIAFGTLSSFLT